MGLRIFDPIILITQAERLAYTIFWKENNTYLKNLLFITTSIFKTIFIVDDIFYILKAPFYLEGEESLEIPLASGLFYLSLICPQALPKNIVSSTAWRLFSGENKCFNCDIVFPFDTPFNL